MHNYWLFQDGLIRTSPSISKLVLSPIKTLAFCTMYAPRRGTYDRSASASERARRQRELLLARGAEVLAAHLPESCSVADVLGATGLGRATFYGHFPDVGAWRDAVLENLLADLAAALQLGDADVTPVARLTAVATAWLGWAARHGDAYRCLAAWRRDALVHAARLALTDAQTLAAAAGLSPAEGSPWRLIAGAGVLLALGDAAAEALAQGPHALDPLIRVLF